MHSNKKAASLIRHIPHQHEWSSRGVFSSPTARQTIQVHVAGAIARLLIMPLVWLVPILNAQEPTSPNTSQVAAVKTSPLIASPLASQPVAALVSEYAADQSTLRRRFRMPLDSAAIEFRELHYQNWQSRLEAIDFTKLSLDDRIDWLALNNEIAHDRAEWDRKLDSQQNAKQIVPYAERILRIGAIKEHGHPFQADELAAELEEIAKQASNLSSNPSGNPSGSKDPTQGLQAVDLVDQLLRVLADTHKFLDSYDPSYSWWCAKPYEAAKQSIGAHRTMLRTKVAGLSDSDADKDKIVGVPIGENALLEHLQHAWIAYSPEELIRIGEQEMEWCDAEFKKAADEMGCNGDWRLALEQVKSLHVSPGEQPRLIRELAWEAIRFLEAHDLVTVPDLAKHGWRVEMMSAEAQRVNPYFLGGENIIVSFPTESMNHAEKLMSLKSNNIHFCRATVHHELIPGHHLQHYANARFRPYRETFQTPFWTEGWALYWEMLLWDLDFPQSVEDRVGMLFWRRHRAARIFFSLNYQSGRWTPEQCVQYLVDRVGHEPSAAAAEVRRSIMGGYGPLYQAAYLLGGLQLRRLHEELVQSGKMTNRQFHDAVLAENHLPIELLRYKLTGKPPAKEAKPEWKFYSFGSTR